MGERWNVAYELEKGHVEWEECYAILFEEGLAETADEHVLIAINRISKTKFTDTMRAVG